MLTLRPPTNFPSSPSDMYWNALAERQTNREHTAFVLNISQMPSSYRFFVECLWWLHARSFVRGLTHFGTAYLWYIRQCANVCCRRAAKVRLPRGKDVVLHRASVKHVITADLLFRALMQDARKRAHVCNAKHSRAITFHILLCRRHRMGTLTGWRGEVCVSHARNEKCILMSVNKHVSM